MRFQGLFRFSLPTIFWIVTLAATSFATFGMGGVLYVGFVSLFWIYVFAAENPRTQFMLQIAILLLAAMLLTMSMPVLRYPREAARRTQCINNIKNISLGLLNYEQANGHLPPPYVADENGKPMHSWRVLILPFTEHNDLFKAYSFDEPWDGPNNINLLSQMPTFYCCPACGEPSKGFCHYAAIAGPDTAWQVEPLTLDSIEAGTSKTLMVCETLQGIPWTQPTDLTPNEFIKQAKKLASSRKKIGHHSEENQMVNLGFADGHVESILVPSEANVFESLASRFEEFNSGDYDLLVFQTRAQQRRWVAFLLLVIVSLIPGYRLLPRR